MTNMKASLILTVVFLISIYCQLSLGTPIPVDFVDNEDSAGYEDFYEPNSADETESEDEFEDDFDEDDDEDEPSTLRRKREIDDEDDETNDDEFENDGIENGPLDVDDKDEKDQDSGNVFIPPPSSDDDDDEYYDPDEGSVISRISQGSGMKPVTPPSA